MELSQEKRSLLQNFVWQTRQILMDEFKLQLQSVYGIDQENGDVLSLDHMSHLGNLDFETARILRDTLKHYNASPGSEVKTEIERIIREQAFTVLNRLAAIKMAERRDVCIEIITNSYEAEGFQVYKNLVKNSQGNIENAYTNFLKSIFDEFSIDLPSLFDRNLPQSRLMPKPSVLLKVIQNINSLELNKLWDYDETIGWVYQYFNSSEERKKMRKESSSPTE